MTCDQSFGNIIPQHPLVPLTCHEINSVANFVRNTTHFQRLREPLFWSIIQLKEPLKDLVYRVDEREILYTCVPRIAEVVIYQRNTARTFIFEVEIDYSGRGGNPKLVCVKKPLEVIPPMDQYVLELAEDWPVFSTDPDVFTVNRAIMNNLKLLRILKTRGITREQLETGQVRADYLGGFEAFRGTNDCARCCQELVNKDEPWYRYATVFFRFFAGSEVFDRSVDSTVQTPVFNLPGLQVGKVPQNGPGSGYYGALARLEGLLVRINVTLKEIIEIVDLGFEQVPNDIQRDVIQRPFHNWRTPVRPMIIDMPEGASHTYDPNTGLIEFDNWQMRLSWDLRAGVQLYNVKYSDTDINTGQEIPRSILYKASLPEATVSYSVGNPLFRRNFTSADSMFYPMGRRLIRLIRGVHVPCHATLVSIPFNGKSGPVDFNSVNSFLPDRIAIYEQDGDLITIFTGLTGPATRGRELVVRSIFSGLFYLWIFDWIFKQDGTIETKAEVSGRLVVALRHGRPESPWGDYVARNYLALTHNHIYNWRFDFDLDGRKNISGMEDILPANNCQDCQRNVLCCSNALTRNEILRCKTCRGKAQIDKCIPKSTHIECKKKCLKEQNEVKKCEDDECLEIVNPCGHATFTRETIFKTVCESVTDFQPQTNRTWFVENLHSTIRFNNGGDTCPIPRGYAILPLNQGTTLAQDWSWLQRNLQYAKHNLFVTVYDDEEQYASGKFPILQPKDVGLGRYIRENANCNIYDEDIVVWYTLPFIHVNHTEDWPFITLEPQTVRLIPHNFFEWNPATTIQNQVIFSNKGYYGCGFRDAVANLPILADPNNPCGNCP